MQQVEQEFLVEGIQLYINPPNLISNPSLKEKYANFCNNLIEVAQLKSGAIILEKTIQSIKSQINRLDQYYQKQAENLKSELQYSENKLQGQRIEDYQYQLEIKLRRVNEEREYFFRDSSKKITDSKTYLMNGFRKRSLTTKISTLVEELEPLPSDTKEFGQVEIKLTKHGQDSHDFMIKLIKSQLKQWVEKEWQKIITKLNCLIEDSYKKLNFIPSFSLSNSFRSPSQQLNNHKILQDSFVAAQNNSFYTQISLEEFMELEESAAEAVPKILEQGTNFVIKLMTSSPSVIIQGGKLLHTVTQLVGSVLSQHQIEKNKLEEVITRLKEQNIQYYQRLAQSLVDRLFNEMMTALDNEENYFRRSLNAIEDQFGFFFRELNRYYKEYERKQQTLQEEMEAFEQIKSLIKVKDRINF